MIRELRFLPEFICSLAFLWCVSTNLPAATLSSTTGSLAEISPPASIAEGALESNTTAYIFAERQAYTLSNDLSLDAINPGADVGPSASNAVAGIIPAGTAIDSFMIHFDSVGQPANAVELTWSSIFQSTDVILGLIYSDALLDSSDFLGAPGTTYPTGLAFRGMTGEQEGIDSLLWSQYFVVQGLQSVTVAVDQVRVILVPEATGVLLTSSTLFVLAAAVRRNRAGIAQKI